MQNRARVASGGEAVTAIRATLDTLSRRLPGDEVKNLAAQLPEEIAYYMQPGKDSLEKMSMGEFFS